MTIYDVARAAGVSPKTVSRVMNGDAPVNVRTREAVEAAIRATRLRAVERGADDALEPDRARRAGHRGDQRAAGGGGATGLPDLQIVQGIQRTLSEAGLTLLISDVGGATERVPQLMRTLREHRVEGLFYVAEYHQRIELAAVARAERLVLVNGFDDAGTPCVLPDDRQGEYELVAALIARGHRRIGFLTLPISLVAYQLRLDGYRQALAEAGIAWDAALVVDADRDGAPEERVAIQGALDAHAGAAGTSDRGLLRQRPDGGHGLRRAPRARRRAAGADVGGGVRRLPGDLGDALPAADDHGAALCPHGRGGGAADAERTARRRDGAPGTRVLVQGDLRWRASVVPGPATFDPRSNPRRKTMTTLTRLAAGLLASTFLAGAAAAQTDLSLWYHGAGNEVERNILAGIVDDFNASQKDWKVSIEQFPQAAYNDSVTAAALSGELPDILDVDGPIMPNWAWAGYLAPLTIDPAKLDGFLPGVIGKWDGKVYSVGFWDAALAVFARKSVLDENGIRIPTLDKPWTGDEFNEILAKLKATAASTSTRSTSAWPTSRNGIPTRSCPFLWSTGGDLVDRSTYQTAEGALNGDDAIKWGEWSRGSSRTAWSPGTSQSLADRQNGFAEGKYALNWTGNWLALSAAREVRRRPPVPARPRLRPRRQDRRRLLAVRGLRQERAPGRRQRLHRVRAAGQILHRLLRRHRADPADPHGGGGQQVLRARQADGGLLDLSEKQGMLRPVTPGYVVQSKVFQKVGGGHRRRRRRPDRARHRGRRDRRRHQEQPGLRAPVTRCADPRGAGRKAAAATQEAPPQPGEEGMASRLLSSNRAGWSMAAPAVGLILLFIIVPFVLAFGLSFTNQRLFSPNPTQWVGTANFKALLGVGVLTLEPERDDAGAVKRDADGQPSYPRLRGYTRNNPDYPNLQGMQEWFSFQRGDNRTYVLASDVVFMKALRNTFLFVLLVAPLQGGLALLLRADGQPEAPRHQFLPRRLLHAGGGLDRRGVAALALHLRRRQRAAEQRARLGQLRRRSSRWTGSAIPRPHSTRSSPCRSGRRWAFTW